MGPVQNKSRSPDPSPVPTLMGGDSNKLEVLREHRHPPNVRIIELWQFFPDPDRDPERTSGSR